MSFDKIGRHDRSDSWPSIRSSDPYRLRDGQHLPFENVVKRSTTICETRATKESLDEAEDEEQRQRLRYRGQDRYGQEYGSSDDIDGIAADPCDFTKWRPGERSDTICETNISITAMTECMARAMNSHPRT